MIQGALLWLMLAHVTLAQTPDAAGPDAPPPADGNFEGWETNQNPQDPQDPPDAPRAEPPAPDAPLAPPPAAAATVEPAPTAGAATAPAEREEVLRGAWQRGMWPALLAGGATAGVLCLATPLLLPPVGCVAPLAMPVVGAVAGATAWMTSWLLNRRAPLGGMMLAGALTGVAGGAGTLALLGAAGMMGFAALANAGPQLWFGLAAGAALGWAAVGWLLMAGLAVGLMAVLAGPCSRDLVPGEAPFNLDLLGAPGVDTAFPSWMQKLEEVPEQARPPAPTGAAPGTAAPPAETPAATPAPAPAQSPPAW